MVREKGDSDEYSPRAQTEKQTVFAEWNRRAPARQEKAQKP
jgi:hypothetical protein